MLLTAVTQLRRRVTARQSNPYYLAQWRTKAGDTTDYSTQSTAVPYKLVRDPTSFRCRVRWEQRYDVYCLTTGRVHWNFTHSVCKRPLVIVNPEDSYPARGPFNGVVMVNRTQEVNPWANCSPGTNGLNTVFCWTPGPWPNDGLPSTNTPGEFLAVLRRYVAAYQFAPHPARPFLPPFGQQRAQDAPAPAATDQTLFPYVNPFPYLPATGMVGAVSTNAPDYGNLDTYPTELPGALSYFDTSNDPGTYIRATDDPSFEYEALPSYKESARSDMDHWFRRSHRRMRTLQMGQKAVVRVPAVKFDVPMVAYGWGTPTQWEDQPAPGNPASAPNNRYQYATLEWGGAFTAMALNATGAFQPILRAKNREVGKVLSFSHRVDTINFFGETSFSEPTVPPIVASDAIRPGPATIYILKTVVAKAVVYQARSRWQPRLVMRAYAYGMNPDTVNPRILHTRYPPQATLNTTYANAPNPPA